MRFRVGDQLARLSRLRGRVLGATAPVVAFTGLLGAPGVAVGPLGQVTEFAAGVGPSAGLSGITSGPDGNLWFTEFRADQVARIGPGACLAPPPSPPSAPEPVVIAPRFTG